MNASGLNSSIAFHYRAARSSGVASERKTDFFFVIHRSVDSVQCAIVISGSRAVGIRTDTSATRPASLPFPPIWSVSAGQYRQLTGGTKPPCRLLGLGRAKCCARRSVHPRPEWRRQTCLPAPAVVRFFTLLTPGMTGSGGELFPRAPRLQPSATSQTRFRAVCARRARVTVLYLLGQRRIPVAVYFFSAR